MKKIRWSFCARFAGHSTRDLAEHVRLNPTTRRCHGLAPWSLTLVATSDNSLGDATGLPRGGSRLRLL